MKLTPIDKVLFVLAICIGLVWFAFAALANPQKEAVVAGSFAPSGGTNYRLQADIGSADSSFTLTSFKEPVSNTPYTMSYLGSDIEYGTLSPNTSLSEFISFTGITQNSNGTATLTGVLRGLSRSPGISSCVASSTLANPHSGQSIFILSNSPCFQSEYALRRSPQNITGTWFFTTSPFGSTPTSSLQLATKAYVDQVAALGSTSPALSLTGSLSIAGPLTLRNTNSYIYNNATLAAAWDGLRNTFFGLAAGTSTTSGVDNTALGYQAATTLTTGNGNVVLGSQAGNLISGGYDIFVGYGTQGTSTTASRYLNIGNGLFGYPLGNAVGSASSTGLFSLGVSTTSLNSTLNVGGNATIGKNLNAAAPYAGLLIEGKTAIGTSTPVANFQVTATSTNASTTAEFGKAGQTAGTCLKLYRGDGSAIYAWVNTGATTLTLSTTACASVTGF